jgi:predicted MFS family arabinose efflux permease
MLLMVELIFTLGEMLSGPHMQKMVSVMAPEQHRGLYFSVFGMSWQISRGIGPMAGGLLFEKVSGSFLFTVLAAIILLGGIAQQFIIRSLEKKTRETTTTFSA